MLSPSAIDSLFGLTALACAALGLVWLCASAPLMRLWGAAPGPASLMASRRLGAAFLGFAVIFRACQGLPAGPARQGLCLAGAAATGLFCALSLWDLSRGRANRWVALSAALEGALALAFALAWLS